MKSFCQRVVKNVWFERFIIGVIILNGAVLGLETLPEINASYGSTFVLINNVVIGVFVLEAAMKLTAVAPQYSRYFGNKWNLFDFSVVLLSLVPATGQFATIARTARLLRVVRLISAVPELRLIVDTLVKSLPSMANVVMLMGVIFYIYAITGYHLFHLHDPQHWGNVGISLLTLFRIVTLEDWTDVMYTAMQMHPLSWIYFVSFVVVGTFVVINLFIAVVLNNLEETKAERLKELQVPATREELLRELRNVQESVEKLQTRLREVHKSEIKDVAIEAKRS